MGKKSVRSSGDLQHLKWSREWYQSASAEELLNALSEAEITSNADTAMQQFVDQLIWEVRFQMLEDELRRRMIDVRSA
jgi:hypothetical protein